MSNALLSVCPFPASQVEVIVLDAFARATARAALSSAHARGRNNREFADHLAVEALRSVLNEQLPVGAEVIIGEGERDEAPMLYIGERLGPNKEAPPELLIAVDPLEGTNLAAHWHPGAICVLAGALVGEGTIWRGIDGYMSKFIVGGRIARALQKAQESPRSEAEKRFCKYGSLLAQPIEDTVSLFSEITGKPITSLVAELLDRPRNEDLIDRLRRLHVQVRLISDGDVTSAWRVLSDSDNAGVDFYVGIGAAPEGVLAAAMTNVMRGYMEGTCWFDESTKASVQKQRFQDRQIDTEKTYRIDELAGGNVMISFTPVTDCGMLPGVSYGNGGFSQTHTVRGRSRTGTYYISEARHNCPPPPPAQWPINDD